MAGNTNATAEQFCRDVLSTSAFDITWFSRDGYVALDNDRRARITLSEDNPNARYPTSGDYASFVVTIISKATGTLARQTFAFDNFLKERNDGRTDYPIGNNTTFHVIDHCGWKWYIAEPTSTKPLVDAIDAFIGLFS